MTHVSLPQVKDSLILITLLVELGVAAAFAAILARTTTFKNLLLNAASHRAAETGDGGDDHDSADAGRVAAHPRAQLSGRGPFV